jgi:hypothetical protein
MANMAPYNENNITQSLYPIKIKNARCNPHLAF